MKNNNNPNYDVALRFIADDVGAKPSLQFLTLILFYCNNNHRQFSKIKKSLSESPNTTHLAENLSDVEEILWPFLTSKNPMVVRAKLLSKAMALLNIGIEPSVSFFVIATLSVLDQKGDQFSLEDAARIKTDMNDIFGE